MCRIPKNAGRSILALVLLTTATAGAVNDVNFKHRYFADALTKSMYQHTDDKNQCSSAWGVSMALDLVRPGMDSDGAKQTADVVFYNISLADDNLRLFWDETASRIDGAYDGQCSYELQEGWTCRNELPMLEIANSIWLDDGDSLVEVYEDIVGEHAHQIDFADETAGGLVNSWVENNTNGLIESVVEEGPIDTATPPDLFLLAINSIYLKAAWMKPFQPWHTNEDMFYTVPDSTPKKAHFMHQVGNFEYSHDALPGYKILKLPFNGNSLSTMLVLPMKDNANSPVSSADVLALLPRLQETRVAVAVPKFKFKRTYEDDLEISLKTLGLTRPFEGGLCGLVEGNCGFISFILQKTAIDFNEDGVEAAAVTVIAIEKTGMPMNLDDPELFIADRPFQFFIYDETQDIVVFEGRVVDPGIATDTAEPMLQRLHSDEDFWERTFGVSPAVIHVNAPILNDSLESFLVKSQSPNRSGEREVSCGSKWLAKRLERRCEKKILDANGDTNGMRVKDYCPATCKMF